MAAPQLVVKSLTAPRGGHGGPPLQDATWKDLVRMRGFEPPQDCSYSVLSAARLPFRHIRISIDCDTIEAKTY